MTKKQAMAAISLNVSEKLLERARRVMPGGVNSPVRSFASVGGNPVFVRKAEGARIETADGASLIDYVSSWGPAILGHAHPAVVQAVQQAAKDGLSFGAPTEGEVELAELVKTLVPSMQMSRMVSSGTEAVMGAVRAARGHTGRDLIIKFEGNYHGGADYLLVKAGSGAATLGVSDSAGVPEAIAKTTLLARYNDIDSVRVLFEQNRGQVAAVLVEPVAGNMGCVPPLPGFLESLQALAREHESLLVFDEVMTGFRVALGGAQELYGVTPDLSCFGKIVGGGLPAAMYGGRTDVMSQVAPSGAVYQAGTLSGNPLAVAAARSTLGLLIESDVYGDLEKAGKRLESGFTVAAREAGASVVVQRVGSMLTPFFASRPVRNWDDADGCDRRAFARWHRAMLEEGVHWPPSPFESGFISAAHTADVIDETIRASKVAFKKCG